MFGLRGIGSQASRVVAPSVARVTVVAALLAPIPALAADPGEPRSGFYVGGNVGYGFGYANAALSDPGVATGRGTTQYGSLFGGVQAGYEHFLPSRLMLGIEADLSFSDYMDFSRTLSTRVTASASATEQLDYLGTLRGRVGYSMGSWTPFVTGGLAWASTRFSRVDTNTGNEDANPAQLRSGYALGAGVDYKLDRRWSARVEYLYTYLGLRGYSFASTPARYDTQYDLNRFRVSLNYHFGESESDSETKADDLADSRRPGTWEIHGQSTFIFQGYPPMRAPYDGPNSLPGVGQSRETWSVSAFLGIRLWRGGELYYNPELLQGFGVASTVGAGGYPQGEAQKSNFPFPQYSTSRLFLRQEIGLGGETERVEGEYGQLSGNKDISRLTFQVGRFSVHDFFDTNDYAQDSRRDFLNWSIWAAGAFDYAADRIGLTYGATAELNQPNWTLLLGYFLVGNLPNASVFDVNLFSRGMYASELEVRYTPFDRPGAAKIGLWFSNTFAGSYADAVSLATANGASPNDTIAQTRQSRIKTGYYVNLQQEILDDVGFFARWSWNDGHSEISAFSDIDSSLSGGISVKGKRWGRPDDTVGLAAAVNRLSGEHVAYLAAGGLGILVGDGQLNYAPETIVEGYYSLQLMKGFVATADYQLLINPAYNADRGPVHVFSGRLRASF